MFKFCPGEKCKHYGEATKYPRKCYYEAQCWRGWTDIVIAMFGIILRQWWMNVKWRNREVRIKND